MVDDTRDLNEALERLRRACPAAGPDPYRFGDATRLALRWLGPHARAARGKIDWLKFGKAVVAAFVAGQTVNLGVVAAALAGSVKDPAVAASIPAVATALVYVVEQGRRLLQDGRDAGTPPAEPHADAQKSVR